MRNGKLLLGLALLAGGLLAGRAYVNASQRMRGPTWDRLLPQAKKKAIELVQLAQSRGLDVMFFEGWRSPESSQANIKAGTSKVKDPLDSMHVWGAGFDIVFRNQLGLPYWPPAPNEPNGDPRWRTLAQLGASIGLKSGGLMWGWDWPHFQLPDVNVYALKEEYGENYLAFLQQSGAVVV